MDISTLAAAKSYTNNKIEEVITSGGGSGGNTGTSLKAGDFIEIKDGVIRSTFGDVVSGGLEEHFEEVFSVQNIQMKPQGNGIIYSRNFVNAIPELGEIIKITFALPNENNPHYYIVETVDSSLTGGLIPDGLCAICNADIQNGNITILDPTIPAFIVHMTYLYDDEPCVFIYSFVDYTGASLSVGKRFIVDTRKYALLPDNALGLGREIITEQEKTVFNIDDIQLEETDGNLYRYVAEVKYDQLFIDDIVNIDIKLPNEDKIHNFTTKIKNFVIAEGMDILIAECNCILSIDENSGDPVVTILDPSLPSVVIAFINSDGESGISLITPQDYSGFSITCKQKYFETSYVKLTNKALSFDEEPSKDSENLVNSNGIYNAFNKFKDSFVFDEEPTKDSENFINSNGIYNALNELSEKLKVEPQLNEGLFQEKANNGFSANRNSYPTSENAWIEGRAANGTDLPRWWFEVNDGIMTLLYWRSASENIDGMIEKIVSNGTFIISFQEEPEKKYILDYLSHEHLFDLQTLHVRVSFREYNNKYPEEGTYSKKIHMLKSIPLTGIASHSEGSGLAQGAYSHAEGKNTVASGWSSHAEGIDTTASGQASHAEGRFTTASGWYSHAEGIDTTASGQASHAEGNNTIASGGCSHVQGKYNVEDTENKYAHIIGNGTDYTSRSNAHTVDWEGNAWYSGGVTGWDLFCALTPSAPFHEILSRTWEYDISAGETNIFGSAALKRGRWYTISLIKDEETIIIPIRLTSDSIDCGSFDLWHNPDPDYNDEIDIQFQEDFTAPFTITISEHENSNDSLVSYVLQLEERIQTLEEKLKSQ